MTLHIKTNSHLKAVVTKLLTRAFRKKRIFWHKLLKLFVLLGLKSNPRAVFIVGSGRSGTDILVDCLDHSIRIKTINEDNEQAFINWRLKDLPVVKAAIDSSGASFVTLKPIVETMRIKELLEYFPESKGVFIFRNYNDAINSQIRFFGEKNIRAVQSWIISDFEKFPLVPDELKEFTKKIWEQDKSNESASGIVWLAYNSSYLFLKLKCDSRVHLIQYDELVTNPEKTLRLSCHFIGVPYKKAMQANIYASSISRHSPPSLHPELQKRCHETWQSLKNNSVI